MRVKDYEYNDYVEGLVSQERGEELIAQIEMKIRKGSIPHFEILKIGRNDEEFEFMYNYLGEKEIDIRGTNITMEDMENYEEVAKSGVNYYDLPEVIDPIEEYKLFDKLNTIRQHRENKGQDPLKDDEYMQTRSKIANGNLRLAKYITTLKPFRKVNIEQDDLLAFAYTGLSDAIDKFDYTMGFKFSTYAWPAIYRRIERGIANEYGINQNQYLEYRQLMDTRELFLEEMGREATVEDLKNMLGFSENKIINLFKFDGITVNPDSLEDKMYTEDREKYIDNHSDSGKIEIIWDDDDREKEYYEDGIIIEDENREDAQDEGNFTIGVDSNILKEKIEKVLKTLTPREAEVLRLRFGLRDGMPKTLEEAGMEFNVTRERIRQIEAKALRKLRHPSRSRNIKDFLD